MASIAHLSDVHFGRHDPVIVSALELFLQERKPDLVVISGDLTQRARVEQYQLACEFLDRLEQGGLAVLAVPGNHDVPLYDVVRRFVRPLHRYRRFIDDDLCPYWENGELAVLGINTARSLTFKDGSISAGQMLRIRERFYGASEKLRVLVTHHPLVAMPIGEEDAPTKVANRSRDALRAAADAGVDLLLAGHFHRSFAFGAGHAASEQAADHVENAGTALVVQAGTATSTRLRGDERQSFNWIEGSSNGIDLTVYAWDGATFRSSPPAHFAYDGNSWRTAKPVAV